MADNTYTGLTVGLQLDSMTGDYLVGAELGGAFIPFQRVSQSRVEKYLARAAQSQPATPASAPVEQPAGTPGSGLNTETAVPVETSGQTAQ